MTFQDGFGSRRKESLNRFSDRLNTFNDVTVNVEPIGNPDRLWRTFADPGVIRLSQIHDDRLGIQV